MRFIFFIYWLALVLHAGCGRSYKEEKTVDDKSREQLLEANRAAVKGEANAIDEFIKAHGWNMKRTGTGLNYEIYVQGNENKADGKSLLTFSYKVFLLDGTLCYEADEQQPQKLITGRGGQVNGLEEGLLLMSEGSRARFVIPNHLAYGLTGDQDKIPPASALYYDVHLIKVERPEKKQ